MTTRRLGRPENPYATGIAQWQPGATSDWFPAAVIDRSTRANQAKMRGRILHSRVLDLLIRLGVPVVRRVIEAILVVDHGYNPQEVTNALAALVGTKSGDNQIICTEVPFDRQEFDSKVYTANRNPTAAEMGFLRQLCDDQRTTLTNKIIGDAGERYVRAWLKSTEQFTELTPVHDLGHVRTPEGDHAIDVAATDRVSGDRYAISVKNWRSWIKPDDPLLKDVVKKAAGHSRRPWLVSGFAFEETIIRCRESGIRLTLLGCQIVPATLPNGKRTVAAIKRLRPVVGPQPYRLLLESRNLRSSFVGIRDLLTTL